MNNTELVVLGTALLGLTCGVLGSFVVLRGRALIGDTLAHATLPGVALSYLIVGERDFFAMLLGAFLSSTLAALFMSTIKLATPLRSDSYLSLTLGGWFAIGIMLLDYTQRHSGGDKAGLQSFIFGKAAGILYGDVLTIASVTALVLPALFLLWKEFKLLCFDQNFLRSLGYSVAGLDAILMIMTTCVIISGLPAVGAILVTALLFIPAITARFICPSLSWMVPTAGLLGMLGASGGALLSTQSLFGSSKGVPTGPAIVLVCASLCLAAGCYKKFKRL